MLKSMKRFALSASILTSLSVSAGSALAASMTPTSLDGNFFVYDVAGSNTVKTNYTGLTQAQQILGGSSASPTGNIELFADSESSTYTDTTTGLLNFKAAPVTTLTGTILNNPIVISSLNGGDWFTTDTNEYSTSYGANNLATRWFNAAIAANGFGALAAVNPAIVGQVYSTFLGYGGFAKFSDPNISYVNQADANSQIKIGLAGHYNAVDLLGRAIRSQEGTLLSNLTDTQVATLNAAKAMIGQATSPIQASEVVKVMYGGKTNYLYSFQATRTGLTALDDGTSHNGNYEVSVEPVPEPMTIVTMAVSVGGLVAGRRNNRKKA